MVVTNASLPFRKGGAGRGGGGGRPEVETTVTPCTHLLQGHGTAQPAASIYIRGEFQIHSWLGGSPCSASRTAAERGSDSQDAVRDSAKPADTDVFSFDLTIEQKDNYESVDRLIDDRAGRCQTCLGEQVGAAEFRHYSLGGAGRGGSPQKCSMEPLMPRAS